MLRCVVTRGDENAGLLVHACAAAQGDWLMFTLRGGLEGIYWTNYLTLPNLLAEMPKNCGGARQLACAICGPWKPQLANVPASNVCPVLSCPGLVESGTLLPCVSVSPDSIQ